ncbi:ScbA/BarX family gamma-butyrolactone biosynthesis protein [Sphaerisporangium perillae]|uniref:ScbA/BarX family gamma-butyrolactone biosynthesis protein n=1 Tax=Sphaerisporangium perillae TaxID=2935860 RepID=UPI00200F348A|nr:ScbA/BarX family gamma-butyrolactone biosynthesis protein [Sphaerisporangium perillae]
MATHDVMDVPVDPALFEQTVSRRLVHRAAVSEVMITGWRPLDDKTSILAAQWPRTHGLYGPVGDRHDPLLVAETIRQAGLVVSHAELDCPLDRRFLMWDLSYEVNLANLAIGPGPTNLVLRFTRSQVRHRGRNLAGLRGHVDFYRDGRLVGMGDGSFDCLSEAAHDRLRAPVLAGRPAEDSPLPAPVAPRLVGRDRARDIVLAPTGTEGTWLLRVDPAHPVLFDHGLDHVPGMALMEAMRQATLAIAHPLPVTPVKMYATFDRYVELWGDCLVHARREEAPPGDDIPVRVTIEQFGAVAAAGQVFACRLLPG